MVSFEFYPRYYRPDSEEKYVPVPICDYNPDYLMNRDDVITDKQILRIVFMLRSIKIWNGFGFLDRIEVNFEKENGFTLADFIAKVIATHEFFEEKELLELSRNMVLDRVEYREEKFYINHKN